MKAIEFEADVQNSLIQVPQHENLESRHVRVILMWDQDSVRRLEAKSAAFSAPVLKTKDYRFGRQEANVRS